MEEIVIVSAGRTALGKCQQRCDCDWHVRLGRPIGASGCRILVTLFHKIMRCDAKKGIASLCIGGGMGLALTLER